MSVYICLMYVCMNIANYVRLNTLQLAYLDMLDNVYMNIFYYFCPKTVHYICYRHYYFCLNFLYCLMFIIWIPSNPDQGVETLKGWEGMGGNRRGTGLRILHWIQLKDRFHVKNVFHRKAPFECRFPLRSISLQ